MTLHDMIREMADVVIYNCQPPFTVRNVALCLIDKGYTSDKFTWCLDDIIALARELSEGQERAA
ncbi:hypothetical protein CHELA1G11_13034 [Hyphomicrobiales bacterium]|nr:hypothetical protein CHELA1G2_11276 [Hyphomicrobiales bacterium]CAH1668843.1 hypothetical protein CHELA1G11_13034 [Hyphomicrobiales bacterium]